MTPFAVAADASRGAWPRVGQPGVRRLSPAALTLVLLAHGCLLWALQSWGAVSLPAQPAALMVELLQTEANAPKLPVPMPPKPVAPAPTLLPAAQMNRPAPRQDAPVLASESSHAETAVEVARYDKAPVPPTAAVAAQPAAPVAVAAAAAALAPTAPRFDAAYLDNPAPNYPPLSKRAGEEGRVVLHVFVEATGLAAKVEVRSSSGFERLDRAAIAAVSRWKFVPAKQGNEAVAAWVLVPLVFSLKV